jgi:Flp pilus assembly protein TadD
MSRTVRSKSLIVSLFALVLVGVAAVPAHAQLSGSAKGRVFDDKGARNEASVTLTYLDDKTVPPITVVTEDDTSVGTSSAGTGGTMGGGPGWWYANGLLVGKWQVEVRYKNLVGTTKYPLNITNGEMATCDNITLKSEAAAPKADPAAEAARVKAVADAKRKAQIDALAELFKQADKAIDEGNYDLAVEKMTAVQKEVKECAPCEDRLGTIHKKKGELDLAEASFKKAIELDPTLADPYSALAEIYNEQKKFDDAAKMSQKANELLGATATGGNAQTLYNQGVILWNQGKAAEAQPLFEKAIQLDPKYPDAYFQLGMVLLNQGKLKDAVKPFEKYLELDPKGKNADTVRALLPTIK